MKTLILAVLLFLATVSHSQKIVENYKVIVDYKYGIDTINVENYRHLDIPAPILKDGSLYYDGEYLLLDVKKVTILSKEYAKEDKTVSTSKKYRVKQVKYWSNRHQRWITVNVISDPQAEQEQNQRNLENMQRSKEKFRRGE